MRVWDLTTGRERCTVTRPGGMGYYCAVSPDGRLVLTSSDNTTELWESTTGRCLRTWLKPHKTAAFSGDDRLAILGQGRDAVVRELAPAGPAAAWSYPLPRAATDRVVDGELVGRALARTTRLMAEGRFGAAADEIRAARAVPGYRRHRALLDRWQEIARAGRRTIVADAWLRDSPLKTPDMSDLRYGGLHRAGSLLLTSDGDGTIQVWDLNGGELRHSMRGHTGAVYVQALSEDGHTALSGGQDGLVRAWDLETGRCRHVLEGHTGKVTHVRLSTDGSTGLSATDDDPAIHVWDLRTGERRHVLTGHAGTLFALRMSADGRYAFSAGDDGAPRLWDLVAGRCLHDLRSNETGVGAFALSRSGAVLMTGHLGIVKVRDVRTGRVLHRVPGHDGYVMNVAITADGTTGVSVGIDGTTRIWDLPEGRCRHVSQKQGRFAQSIEISDDDRFAVTGHQDGVIRIWDLDTGALLRALHSDANPAMVTGIGGAGRIVTSVHDPGIIRIWELDWAYDFSGVSG